MKLILRAAAVRDLDDVFDYNAGAHGVDKATAYVRSIEAVMDRLLAHPALGAASDTHLVPLASAREYMGTSG